MSCIVPPVAASVLEEGRQAYVAVRSRNGPHVTPELYAWSGGRLWFAFATSTLKAKVLARDPVASVLVQLWDRSVLLRGRVDVIDPRSALGTVRQLGRLPDLARAMGRFTVRNAPDLMAFVTDTTRGRLGWRPPPIRVLAALTPSCAMVIEGDTVGHATGSWAGIAGGPATAGPVGGQAAVAALPDVVAVPGRWFADEQRLYVLPSLLDGLGTGERFPLGVVTDEYVAPGPAAKQGTLVRGHGRRLDAAGFIEVTPERVVGWDGVDTTSAPVGA